MSRAEIDENYIQREIAGLTRRSHVIFVKPDLAEAEQRVEEALKENINPAAVRRQAATLRETASRGRARRVSGRELMHPVYIDLLQRQGAMSQAAITAINDHDPQRIGLLRESLAEEGARMDSLRTAFGYQEIGRFGQILATAHHYLSAPLRMARRIPR